MRNILKGLILKDTGRLRAPKKQSPDGMTIRIFKNGQVYPSQELIDKFGLEYRDLGTEENPNVDRGFGFDIVDSGEWEPTKALARTILLGHVSKVKPKVDLFANAKYEGGKTNTSVLTQGTVSTVLLDLVRSMGYLTPDQQYCDLALLVDTPLTMENGLSWIPKVIERGVRKGEKTTERREDSIYYAAIPPELIKDDAEAKDAANEQLITQTNTQQD